MTSVPMQVGTGRGGGGTEQGGAGMTFHSLTQCSLRDCPVQASFWVPAELPE